MAPPAPTIPRAYTPLASLFEVSSPNFAMTEQNTSHLSNPIVSNSVRAQDNKDDAFDWTDQNLQPSSIVLFSEPSSR
jgi:hypothetical protein